MFFSQQFATQYVYFLAIEYEPIWIKFRLKGFFYFFYFEYIYTGYNQSVKLFYIGALSKL